MKIKDKILIVEDEQSISNFISMILTANGFDTIIVRTGEEALTMIASHCPDMIVLDLGLPDMDGMEVLKSVRKWSNLPVVVVSARNHEHDKVEALDYGADDYLVKPFGTSELLARIRTAIRHTRTTLSNTQIAQSGKFVTGDLTIDEMYGKETYYSFDLTEFIRNNYGTSGIKRQKLLKNGEAPVCMRITVDKRKAEIMIKRSVPVELWNQSKECSKGKDRNSQELNHYISSVRA